MGYREVGGSVIEVRFTCDHALAIGDKSGASPRCTICGETQVRSVKTTRAPRFVGTVLGPCSDYKGLEPGRVNCAPSGPLRLKESIHG